MAAKNLDKFKQKALREQQKRIKPGECMKYVRIVLDENILNTSYGSEVVEALKKSELRYEIHRLPIKNCIMWERNAGQLLLESKANNALTEEWEKEAQVLYIVTEDELKQSLQTSQVSVLAEKLKTNFPLKRCTLIVLSERALRQDCATARAFIELQLEYQLNCQQLTREELNHQLQRFTKAIAEAPLKQQRAELQGAFKNFLANDKKQCVRVVGRDGLSRLWQQHLNRMAGVTLHLTDTIMEQYSCPKKLVEVYEEKELEAENLLADLRVKRSAQSTQNARRIGEVLSAKYYKLFTSLNPNDII